MLIFGRDCIINIPHHSDLDDTGWHLMLGDMNLFNGKINVSNHILRVRELKVKQETHMGLDIYQARVPGSWISGDHR